MSEQIYYVGKEAAKRIVSKAKEKFSPILHKHTKSDITDLIIDSELSSTSTNPIQNKAVYTAIDAIDANINDIQDQVDAKSTVKIVRWS